MGQISITPTRYDIAGIERRMRAAYDDTMDQVYTGYHCHPTHIRKHGFTPEEEAEFSEMTGLGNWAALGCPM